MGIPNRSKGMDFFTMGVTRWVALVLAVFTFATPALSAEPRVVCYYTNWSVYRPGTARFNPQNINPYLCTHLIYAFGGFTKDNTLKPFDKYQDIEKGGYAKFTGLKTYNKNLKTMLAIGGWNEGSTRFSPMVASREKRREFVRNAIKFLRQNHFDGLDLDWEYPAFRDGGKPKDRENYAKLVKELREEFQRESEKTNKPRLLLTMAVPAGIEYIQKGFDVKTLNEYLDWMNLLTYDYHSAFEPAVDHHAPLYPLEEPNEYSVDNELNIDYTIKFYLESGADADKLVLGIPTYGRSYTLFNPDATELGSPADGPGEQGDATREKGYLAYYEICESLKPKQKKKRASSDEEDEDDDDDDEEEEEDLPWTVVQPNQKAMGPFAYKGNQWVGYDDIDIVKKKAEYVAENGLGGIMFWSIDNDDFRGTCHGKPYPLIEAAKGAYIGRLGSTDNAVLSTERPRASTTRRRNRPSSSTTTTRTTTKSAASRKSGVTSTTPTWNIVTPEPPTTPDPGSDFKCTDEGFFPHPRDCKKYFWCLDSGPSNLGIVAHQFTCPSGLFFNKAADSCDFARNVLCKKPSPTTKAPKEATTKAPTTPQTTTRRTTTTTTEATLGTTRRSIKLSTKSSSLFRTTSSTTTPEPEVEEEYEDEAADIDAEDPKVIKELIDLIRKVGGVEQLEKQLHLSETSSSSSAITTTPSSFNKKLYQKVLERTRSKSRFGNSIDQDGPRTSGSSALNSRGPQNQGLEPAADRDKTLRKDRPQYTTINRSRQIPQIESEDSEEPESRVEPATVSPRARAVEDNKVATTAKPLQYVNIRRARPTDAADDTASRNALFERAEPYVSVSETAGSVDLSSARRENIPEYVTIRRQRPTVEDTTTVSSQLADEEAETQDSQETALEREISSVASPQYTSIVRSRPSTTPPTPEPTTILAVQISSLLNSPNSEENDEITNEPEELTSPTTTTTTAATTTTTTTTTTPSPPPRRIVSRRRGTTTTTTTAAPSVSTTQVSSRNYTFVRRRRPLSTPNDISSDADSDLDASRKVRSTTPDSREVNREIRPSRFRSRTQSPVDDSVPAAASQVSRAPFRPRLSNNQQISLTPIDVDEVPQFVVRPSFAQRGNRRFKLTTTTVSDQYDESDSEGSAASVEVGSPSVVPRGRSRFSPNIETTQSPRSFENEGTVSSRRPTFARFSPRPFTRPVTQSNIRDDQNIAVTQPALRLPFGRVRPSPATQVIQARKNPFSFGRSTTAQALTSEYDEALDEEKPIDDISLSESSIEEKEENFEENIETALVPKRRIIVKKLRASTTTEIPNITEVISEEPGNSEALGGRKKIRVIRRRPTSTTVPMTTSTESVTTNVPRIRKVIRKKVRPIEDEPEIIAKSINSVQAPKESFNYGEKTKTTPITTTETPTTVVTDIDTEYNTEPSVETEKASKNYPTQTQTLENNNSSEIIQNEVADHEVVGIATIDDETQNKNEDENVTVNQKLFSSITEQESSSLIASNLESNPPTTEQEPSSPETTTTSTTVVVVSSSTSSRFRLPYKPSKRFFTSTTESVPQSSRTFSRKYKPGVYSTSPASVEREPFRPVSTRRPLFSSRTYTRRPFTTARTTKKVEEEEYEDDEDIEEEPEDSLVLVPPSQLFTRNQNNDNDNQDDAYESDDEGSIEEEEPPRKFTPSSRRPNFGPRVVNSNTFRTSTTTTELPKRQFGILPNKTTVYNRFGGNETKKRVQNVPPGYNPDANKTSVSEETPAKDNSEENNENEEINTTLATSEASVMSTTEDDDDYLSMTDTTTNFGNNGTTDEITDNSTTDSETSTIEMEIDTSTDDYLEFDGFEMTTNNPTTLDVTSDQITETDAIDDLQTTLLDQVTEKSTPTTTTTTTTTTTAAPVIQKIKTQFDKLFSVSRVIEVSSKLDKHRLNKNNETTLIEEGSIMVEKKPKEDKIGEVSRYSLIKIFEDEIPIYLTKLGHVYPVEHPPDNLIRIDEARNARALVNFVETPRDTLVASESMNEAYRHITKIAESKNKPSKEGHVEVEHVVSDDFLSYVNDDHKRSNDDDIPQWQFIPAAYENDKLKQSKHFEVITPRTMITNPSTLSLEGLFKTENPTISRKMNDTPGQPFVVYSASVPHQIEEANIVKLDVLKPESGRSIVTFAKGQEFKGLPISEESSSKSPISISVLPHTSQSTSISSSVGTSPVVSSTTENIKTSPIIELLTTTVKPLTTSSETKTTVTTTVATEAPATTETISEETTTTQTSPVDAKRSKFAFPRRPVLKTGNLNKFKPVPRVAKRINSTTVNNLNVKANKTSAFTPSKSRFTAVRAQNVPVDARQKSVTPKVFTTEAPRSTTERKPYFKQVRPGFRPAFIPRKSTTAATTISEDT